MKFSLDKFSLKGKVALISGGSRGLGLAIGRGLGLAGARVALAARSFSDDIGDFPGRDFVKECDILVEKQIDRLIAEIVKRCGGIDILVNSAGMNIRGPAEKYSMSDWDKVFELNLRAMFQVSRKTALQMIGQRRGGAIINMASLMSEAARPTTAAYAASKGGVKLLTKSLAVEWARYGIRVNAIGPGYFMTEMTKPLLKDKKFDKWVKERTPMRRWGLPDELIGAAVFLASDAASFITGQTIYVDGGRLAQL